MTEVFFLEADTPLTKQYAVDKDGNVEKSSYPFVRDFTSHRHEVNGLEALYKAIQSHSPKGHCLLKGTLTKTLKNESRAGSTDSFAETQWVCFDLDKVGSFASVEDFLATLGMSDVSYIVQYSSSYGVEHNYLPLDTRLSAHVFIWLDAPISAKLLKQWLIQLNFEHPQLAGELKLTASTNSLSYGLDITTCQNDKLLYIAPPVLKSPALSDTLGRQRIKLVSKRQKTLSIDPSKIAGMAANYAKIDEKVNELRKQLGMPLRKKTTFKTDAKLNVEYLAKPDQAVVTGVKQERGFVYLNLNGGDSWGYFFPEDQPEVLQNFKGEPNYLLKEIAPDFYQRFKAQLSEQRNEHLLSTREKERETGRYYLAFRDFNTASYYNGWYDRDSDELMLKPAKSEKQLRDFLKQYGLELGEFVPDWKVVFDPNNPVTLDADNHLINRYKPSAFEYLELRDPKPTPMIFRLIANALGVLSEDPASDELFIHFINWLAYIIQNKRPAGTCWVWHGTTGCLTGDTVLTYNRGKRNGRREITLQAAYEKQTGAYKQGQKRGKTWQPGTPTYLWSEDGKGFVRPNALVGISDVGVLPIYEMRTKAGRTLKGTADHPVCTSSGYVCLSSLKAGDFVAVREERCSMHKTNTNNRKKRVVVHSIPHHPFAWQHVINGKNYKRAHRARLVVEAALNHMELDEFVQVLRHDAETAATLRYLDGKYEVHHLDGDASNDDFDNLDIVNADEHLQQHAIERKLGLYRLAYDEVVSVKFIGDEQCYDVGMRHPWHNFEANGIFVSNTGKGLLFNRVLRPLIGTENTYIKRTEDLDRDFNGWIENAMLTLVDEVHMSQLLKAKLTNARLKNWITEPILNCEEKFQIGKQIKNYNNFIFSSNEVDPVHIDHNDRRFNVANFQHQKLRMTDADLAQVDAELEDFYLFLVQYDVDEHAVRTPIQTEAREELMAISRNAIDVVVDSLMQGQLTFFFDQLPDDETTLTPMQAIQLDGYKAVLREWLDSAIAAKPHVMRDHFRIACEWAVGGMPDTPYKFTKFIKHHGAHVKQILYRGAMVQGIAMRWEVMDAATLAAMDHRLKESS